MNRNIYYNNIHDIKSAQFLSIDHYILDSISMPSSRNNSVTQKKFNVTKNKSEIHKSYRKKRERRDLFIQWNEIHTHAQAQAHGERQTLYRFLQ